MGKENKVQKETSKKNMENKKIRVLLMEDDRIARIFYRDLFSKADDLEIMQETKCGEEALEYLKKNDPDLIMLDLGVQNGGLNGLHVGSKLKEIKQDIPIIVVTQYDCYYPHCESWANAYMIKEDIPEFLLPACRELMRTQKGYISKNILEPISNLTGHPFARKLSKAELRVANATTQGLSAGGVASRLGISINTVYNHLSTIYFKLQLPDNYRNQHELVRIMLSKMPDPVEKTSYAK